MNFSEFKQLLHRVETRQFASELLSSALLQLAVTAAQLDAGKRLRSIAESSWRLSKPGRKRFIAERKLIHELEIVDLCGRVHL